MSGRNTPAAVEAGIAAFIEILGITAAALGVRIQAATAAQVAACVRRRAPPPPEQALGLHLAIVIEQFGRGSRKLAETIIAAAARYYAKHPDKVAQHFTPVEIEQLTWEVPAVRDQLHEQALPHFARMPRAELPCCRVDDARKRIRESRAFESTTGPPPRPRTPNAPDLPKHGAPSSLNSVDDGIQPENSTRCNSEISGNTPLVAEILATADRDDLEFLRKLNLLWRLGARQAAEFALVYTLRNSTRTQLETELNRFLDQGETT